MTTKRITDAGLECDLEQLTTGEATPAELLADAKRDLPAWQARMYVDVLMHLAARDDARGVLS